jgi:hypothetical protein
MTNDFENLSRQEQPKKTIFIILSVFALLIALLIALHIWAKYEIDSGFYPNPQSMPPVVSETTEQLLVQLEGVLEKKAPAVLQTLQPGLSEKQIIDLEKNGGFTLSADLRKLYQWRNGTKGKEILLIPGYRFPPLEKVVVRRVTLENYILNFTSKARVFDVLFKGSGSKKTWLQIFYDGGDHSYFYDSYGAGASGGFFYFSMEGLDYIFFPSVRNFLKGLIDCYQQDIIIVKDSGSSLFYDTMRAKAVWRRLGYEYDPNH